MSSGSTIHQVHKWESEYYKVGRDYFSHMAKHKIKPTTRWTQPSVTDFFDKKPTVSKAAAKPASKAKTTTTACKASRSRKAQPPPKMPPVKKAAKSSDADEIFMDDPESSAPVMPHATAPRWVLTTKTAYIELSDYFPPLHLVCLFDPRGTESLDFFEPGTIHLSPEVIEK